MKPVTPEFSRPVEASRIARAGSTEKISADAKECVALARRLDLPGVHGLSAVLRVEPWRAGGLKVRGQLVADIEQLCSITLEPFRGIETRAVERYFLPPQVLRETSGEDADVDTLEEGRADLGELVAETLALELDPYPRKPGAVFAAHIESAPAAAPSPFAVLSGTRRGDPT